MLQIVNSINRKPELREFTIKDILRMYRAGWNPENATLPEGLKPIITEYHTQRNFLYADHTTTDQDGKSCTDGAWLIKSILTSTLPIIPEIDLWEITDKDTSVWVVTDGKQRVTTIAGYVGVIAPLTDRQRKALEEEQTTEQNYIQKIKDNLSPDIYEDGVWRNISWTSLTPEEQEAYLQFPIHAVIHYGTKKEQTTSFQILGSTGLPLSPYESIKGPYLGTFLEGFEEYISDMSRVHDSIIDPTNPKELLSEDVRGAQTLYLLTANMGRYDLLEKKCELLELAAKIAKNNSSTCVYRTLEELQDTPFDAKYGKFDEIIDVFGKIRELPIGFKNVPIQLLIAKEIVDKGYAFSLLANWVKSHLNENGVLSGDAKNWGIDTWKTCLRQLRNGITIDPLRNIPKALKDRVVGAQWNERYVCPCCPNIVELDDISIDHKHPWSMGGATIFENLRVVHKKCNSEKGNKITEDC